VSGGFGLFKGPNGPVKKYHMHNTDATWQYDSLRGSDISGWLGTDVGRKIAQTQQVTGTLIGYRVGQPEATTWQLGKCPIRAKVEKFKKKNDRRTGQWPTNKPTRVKSQWKELVAYLKWESTEKPLESA